MKNLYLAMLIFCFVSSSYSQSKIELDKQSLLYKTNKVKIQTIDYGSGLKKITKYNKNGKPTESNDYDNNVKIDITIYKYDTMDRLIEESWYGYESKYDKLTNYYYDDGGNIVKIIEDGADWYEERCTYDSYGYKTEFEERYETAESAPYFTSIINTYESDKLVLSEQECTHRTNEVNQTKYTYNEENIILIEEFWKYCQTDKFEFHTKQSFEYFENGLIKESIQEGISYKVPEKKVYSYEFY